MQVWPPKELPIIKMTDDMLISGVSIREFEAILKTGFSKMYAETRSRITPPIETRAISKSHAIAGSEVFSPDFQLIKTKKFVNPDEIANSLKTEFELPEQKHARERLAQQQ